MRNEKSTFGSVSLTLGSIWLFMFIIAFFVLRILMGMYWSFTVMTMMAGYVLIFVIPLLAVIYGIIGLVKDRKIVMAIIGLNLGIFAFIVLFIFFLTPFLYYPYFP